MPNPWSIIHAERKALLADLEGLTEEQWATPSQCGDWNVHQVLGHMVATAKITPPRFFAGLLASGFRFHTMSAKNVARETAGEPAATLNNFRQLLTATDRPPGPIDAMLGEVIVHGEDIRRPLGIAHSYPTDAVTRVADFYKTSNLLLGGKTRIAGLTLRATDTEWSTGAGPEVAGPALSLVLAITGRRDALADLSGDGLATLRSRL